MGRPVTDCGAACAFERDRRLVVRELEHLPRFAARALVMLALGHARAVGGRGTDYHRGVHILAERLRATFDYEWEALADDGTDPTGSQGDRSLLMRLVATGRPRAATHAADPNPVLSVTAGRNRAGGNSSAVGA